VSAPLRTTIRIDLDNGARLGPGKAQLLGLIEQHGSIRAAGAAMDMSYRRAWLLGNEINSMFREPSIFTRHGGKSGGGAGLTPFGAELLARYRRMEEIANQAICADLDWLGSQTEPGFRPEDSKAPPVR
jgi:molybdate transport system regulatory protein